MGKCAGLAELNRLGYNRPATIVMLVLYDFRQATGGHIFFCHAIGTVNVLLYLWFFA
jgi:hypothetical protein